MVFSGSFHLYITNRGYNAKGLYSYAPKIHSSGLQKGKKSTIFTSIFTFGLKKKNTQRIEKRDEIKRETDVAFLFLFFFQISAIWLKKKYLRNCTRSCNTLSLLPMPLERESGLDVGLYPLKYKYCMFLSSYYSKALLL